MSTVDSGTTEQPTQTQEQPPAAPPAAPPQEPRREGPSFGSELLTAVNALPEKLVNAMREAAPKAPAAPPKPKPDAPQSTSDKKDTSTVDNPGPQNVHKGRGDRFRDWWWK